MLRKLILAAIPVALLCGIAFAHSDSPAEVVAVKPLNQTDVKTNPEDAPTTIASKGGQGGENNDKPLNQTEVQTDPENAPKGGQGGGNNGGYHHDYYSHYGPWRGGYYPYYGHSPYYHGHCGF